MGADNANSAGITYSVMLGSWSIQEMRFKRMNKTTKDEYLAALEDANQDDEEYQIDDDQALGELSEAERSAMRADPPRVRQDGKPVGSEERKRIQPLTVSQVAFAQGIIQGKTYRQAYRDAYPNAQGSDASITSSAYKLSKDPRVQAMVNDALDETIEHLAEDRAHTERYVMKRLLALSKQGKQEGSQLKALELLGKSVGMFIDKAETKPETVTADQLKKELSGHLKLLVSDKRKAV